MSRDEIKAILTELMRSRFGQPTLMISDATTADEVSGWDSLSHIDLILAVERRFALKMTTRQVRGMKDVGALIDIIEKNG